LTDHELTPGEPHGGVEVGRFGFFWSCTFAVFSVAHEASFSIPSTNFVRGTRGPDGFSSSDSRQHRTMRHPFNRTRGQPPNYSTYFRKASDRARCAPTNTTDQPIRGDAACRPQIHECLLLCHLCSLWRKVFTLLRARIPPPDDHENEGLLD
jgi:hypothetical protein